MILVFGFAWTFGGGAVKSPGRYECDGVYMCVCEWGCGLARLP